MGKQIMYDDVARRKAVAGVEKLAKAVKVTLGPAGKNVSIEKSFGGPRVTRDGVTVAKEVDLDDPFENMGAKLGREVASKTNDVAGDGTTTATVLAEAILTIGQRYLTSGVDPNDLRNGIDTAVQAVCAELSSEAMKSYTDRPRTCGIITFYQKQRSTICLELQKLGIKVVNDPSNRWSKNNHHKDGYHTPSQAVSVKTVDGFQVSQKGQKRSIKN